jgi:hypothetical protein
MRRRSGLAAPGTALGVVAGMAPFCVSTVRRVEIEKIAAHDADAIEARACFG